MKEHTLVYIMANVALSGQFTINAIVTSQMYYGLSMDYWFQIVLVLAPQLTGFGLAGLCRRFFVWPASYGVAAEFDGLCIVEHVA
jgi:hypothetical protein